jgi:hypothetical protein
MDEDENLWEKMRNEQGEERRFSNKTEKRQINGLWK